MPNTKRTVQRQRDRDLAAPVNPRSLATLVILPEYQQILLDANIGDEQFLLHDSGTGEDRILIFGTNANLTAPLDI